MFGRIGLGRLEPDIDEVPEIPASYMLRKKKILQDAVCKPRCGAGEKKQKQAANRVSSSVWPRRFIGCRQSLLTP